jgi:hypothetical protein
LASLGIWVETPGVVAAGMGASVKSNRRASSQSLLINKADKEFCRLAQGKKQGKTSLNGDAESGWFGE